MLHLFRLTISFFKVPIDFVLTQSRLARLISFFIFIVSPVLLFPPHEPHKFSPAILHNFPYRFRTDELNCAQLVVFRIQASAISGFCRCVGCSIKFTRNLNFRFRQCFDFEYIKFQPFLCSSLNLKFLDCIKSKKSTGTWMVFRFLLLPAQVMEILASTQIVDV